MPLYDVGVSNISGLLSKLPHEFTVDRTSTNGEPMLLKIIHAGQQMSLFLRASLSHRSSVRPSVCHTGGLGKNGPS